MGESCAVWVTCLVLKERHRDSKREREGERERVRVRKRERESERESASERGKEGRKEASKQGRKEGGREREREMGIRSHRQERVSCSLDLGSLSRSLLAPYWVALRGKVFASSKINPTIV